MLVLGLATVAPLCLTVGLVAQTIWSGDDVSVYVDMLRAGSGYLAITGIVHSAYVLLLSRASPTQVLGR